MVGDEHRWRIAKAFEASEFWEDVAIDVMLSWETGITVRECAGKKRAFQQLADGTFRKIGPHAALMTVTLAFELPAGLDDPSGLSVEFDGVRVMRGLQVVPVTNLYHETTGVERIGD